MTVKLYEVKVVLSVGYPEYKDGETPTGRNIEHKGRVVMETTLPLCATCYNAYANHTLSYAGPGDTLGMSVSLIKSQQKVLRGSAKCHHCGERA